MKYCSLGMILSENFLEYFFFVNKKYYFAFIIVILLLENLLISEVLTPE